MEQPSLSFVYALGTAGAPMGLAQMVVFALILTIFYVLILLPMKRRQKKIQEFQQGLKVGDKVITTGGMYGSITRVSDQTVQLQVGNNVRIEVSRAAIAGYQGQEPVVGEGGL